MSLRNLAVWAAVIAAGFFILSQGHFPTWIDPKAPAAYDDWGRDICYRNDGIDAEARVLFPQRHLVYDPDFLTKTGSLVEQKRELLAEVRARTPVVWRRGVHGLLETALEDSIRQHEARRAQYVYTERSVAATVDRGRVAPEDVATVWTMTAGSAPDADRARQMGTVYQRMYDDVRERLGLEPTAVWPPSMP